MLESAEIPGGRVGAGMACEDGHGGDHNDQGDIYIMYVCLYVTKNEHFVSKKDVLPLSVCLSRSIITSHVNIKVQSETLRTPQNVPAQTVSQPHDPILGLVGYRPALAL